MSAEHGSSHGHDGPPPPPEPQTPMWLPALGAVLFLVVGLWWATRPATPEPIADETAAADAGAAPSAPTAAAPSPGANAPRPGAGVVAAAADAGRLSPEQAAQLQKMLQGMGH